VIASPPPAGFTLSRVLHSQGNDFAARGFSQDCPSLRGRTSSVNITISGGGFSHSFNGFDKIRPNSIKFG
jgi:hypothetical protein